MPARLHGLAAPPGRPASLGGPGGRLGAWQNLLDLIIGMARDTARLGSAQLGLLDLGLPQIGHWLRLASHMEEGGGSIRTWA